MHRIRVMVVEDCEVDMTVITEALSAADINYIAVSDSREALAAAKQFKPSVVLLDMHMPGMSGKQVREQLHTDPETSHMKVIFLSASDCVNDVLYGLNVQASAYFKKGIKIGHLINSITTIDGTARLRSSLNDFSAQNRVLFNKYDKICAAHKH